MDMAFDEQSLTQYQYIRANFSYFWVKSWQRLMRLASISSNLSNIKVEVA
jgi:hypothetical protein